MAAVFALLFIGLFAFLTRAHGHGNEPDEPGSWPEWLRPLSTAWYALTFGVTNYYTYENYTLAVAMAGFTAWAFSTGHGNVYAMQGANPNGNGPEKLETWGGRWLYTHLISKDIYKPAYSWFIMGLKGLLIGLAAAPAGLILAGLWPLAYWLSFTAFKRGSSDVAEWVSGIYAASAILLAFVSHQFLIDILYRI